MKKGTRPQKPKARNFVAKNAHNMGGAGAHEDKKGPKASRIRQKKEWKKDQGLDEDLITHMNEMLVYDNSSDFEQSIKDIENKFGIDLSESASSFSKQQKDDMDKIIKHYGSSFFRDNTKEQVGNDLEMLEYNTQQVDNMVGPIMTAIEKMWANTKK